MLATSPQMDAILKAEPGEPPAALEAYVAQLQTEGEKSIAVLQRLETGYFIATLISLIDNHSQ